MKNLLILLGLFVGITLTTVSCASEETDAKEQTDAEGDKHECDADCEKECCKDGKKCDKDGAKCDKEGKCNGKCGEGKCGDAKCGDAAADSTMKCGTNADGTMKCGEGKCADADGTETNVGEKCGQ